MKRKIIAGIFLFLVFILILLFFSSKNSYATKEVEILTKNKGFLSQKKDVFSFKILEDYITGFAIVVEGETIEISKDSGKNIFVNIQNNFSDLNVDEFLMRRQ